MRHPPHPNHPPTNPISMSRPPHPNHLTQTTHPPIPQDWQYVRVWMNNRVLLCSHCTRASFQFFFPLQKSLRGNPDLQNRTDTHHEPEIKSRQYPRQDFTFTYQFECWWGVYHFKNTYSPITLVNISSINLVVIFRCSSSPVCHTGELGSIPRHDDESLPTFQHPLQDYRFTYPLKYWWGHSHYPGWSSFSMGKCLLNFQKNIWIPSVCVHVCERLKNKI